MEVFARYDDYGLTFHICWEKWSASKELFQLETNSWNFERTHFRWKIGKLEVDLKLL